MDRISEKWYILMFVVIVGILMAVADMNWPIHMGPQNVLVDNLMSLVIPDDH